RAWSSARWCGSSPPARSPTRPCSTSGATRCCSRWCAARPATAWHGPTCRQGVSWSTKSPARTSWRPNSRGSIRPNCCCPTRTAGRRRCTSAAACAGARRGCSIRTAAVASCSGSSIEPQQRKLVRLAYEYQGDSQLFAAVTDDGSMIVDLLQASRSFLTGAIELKPKFTELPLTKAVDDVLVTPDLRQVLVRQANRLSIF